MTFKLLFTHGAADNLDALEQDLVVREHLFVQNIDQDLGLRLKPGGSTEGVERQRAPRFRDHRVEVNRGFLVGQAGHGAGQLAKTVEEKRVRERSGVGCFAIVFETLHRRTDGKRTHDPKLSA